MNIAPNSPPIDMKLEVVVIPVSDVERAKAVLRRAGLEARRRLRRRRHVSGRAGHASGLAVLGPLRHGAHIRSARFGERDVPRRHGHRGSARRARPATVPRSSETFHRAGPGQPPIPGRHPEGHSYSSFATFSDPDGNGWLLQEVTQRLPGRVEADATTFASSTDLAAALRRASAAHGEHEKRTGGQRDENWPDWYAEYMVAEQAGKPLPM